MIRITIDRQAGVRIATFGGVVEASDLLDAYQRVVAEPDYDPTLDDLLDFRGIEHLNLDAEAVRRLAEYFDQPQRPGHQSRLAIVAPFDSVFGMARMYATLRGGVPGQIRVFRQRAEAEAWLGMTSAKADNAAK